MQTYFSRLVSGEEQYAYEAIRQALEQKTAFAEVRCDETSVQVYEAVNMDNPFFALSHPVMQCVYDGRSFAFQYIECDEEKFFSRLGGMEEKIRKRYHTQGDLSAYALYLAIYDEITQTVKYDEEGFRAYLNLQRHSDDMLARETFLRRYGDSFSPYGALVNKKAVCNGIAKLFQILCERFSLPCVCVQARTVVEKDPPDEISNDSQCDHLLNVVEVDGALAFVDVTNGLPNEGFPFTRYDYFMVNYEVLKKVMLLRSCDLQSFPCNGPRNMYYERNKLSFTSVGKLSRFLAGYISKFSGGQVRFSYEGTMSDKKLTDLCSDILTAHCPPLKQICGTDCNQGFGNFAVVDRK